MFYADSKEEYSGKITYIVQTFFFIRHVQISLHLVQLSPLAIGILYRGSKLNWNNSAGKNREVKICWGIEEGSVCGDCKNGFMNK